MTRPGGMTSGAGRERGPARRAGRLLAAAAVCLVLAACWLPERFLGELRLARNGDYALVFDGTLVRMSLAQSIRAGELSAEEIAEQTDILVRDLSRDSGFQTIEPQGEGRFKVRFERVGHLDPRDVYTFVRRNEPIITVETFEDGRAVIRARALARQEKDQVTAAGMEIRGKLRVVTDALPLRGNAQRVSPRGYQRFLVYDWTISGVETAAPFLEVDLTRPAPRP